MKLAYILSLGALAACGTNANGISITLAPDLISSLDASTHVAGEVFANKDPVARRYIAISVSYVDRNGVTRAIAPVSAETDVRGAFDTVVDGLLWDGTGTITATLLSKAQGSPPVMLGGAPVAADASFSVLDRTPPKVSIAQPTNVHPGNDVNVMVHATDEIGVSAIDFQTSDQQFGGGGGFRDRILATGTTDITAQFTFTVQQGTPIGTMITLYADAVDLSGNIGNATPIVVTVN